MSAARVKGPIINDDEDLKDYILDTVSRLNLLVKRLELFAEERHVGESGSTGAGDVDRGAGEQAAP